MLSTVDTSELYLGKIVKAFGIKGELKFLASDDFWPEVLQSKELTFQWLEDGDVVRAPAFIESVRQHGGVYVMRLEDIGDRNAAEAAVGRELFIELDRLDVKLPEHELPHQVVGKTVRVEGGDVIGTVTSLMFSAAHNVYEVTGDGGVVLIPAIEPFVVARDEERDEIVVRPIPGLLDD